MKWRNSEFKVRILRLKSELLFLMWLNKNRKLPSSLTEPCSMNMKRKNSPKTQPRHIYAYTLDVGIFYRGNAFARTHKLVCKVRTRFNMCGQNIQWVYMCVCVSAFVCVCVWAAGPLTRNVGHHGQDEEAVVVEGEVVLVGQRDGVQACLLHVGQRSVDGQQLPAHAHGVQHDEEGVPGVSGKSGG